ncbi:unnamed protein product [Echinostoma caproni]|uniref:Chloride channel CLIC-like protein 1 n=1 Tax=Echinostoma caproni TaxID=27848 RepID=A0A183B788_9TREM|nr:unnamed protein product [Echinostoma caproni]
MFSDSSSSDDYPVASHQTDASLQSSASSPEQVSALKHYRELHRVLARILWRSLSIAENRSLNEDDHVRIHLVASLSVDDIRTLSAYCNLNQTISKHVSADSVNALFSRLFESVAILSDEAPFLQTSNFGYLFCGLGLLVVLLVARLIGVRKILLISVPSLFITAVVLQALYRKYNERLAEKMSHMSRYNEPPEQCKPAHLQSWSTWLSGLIRANPSHDVCAQYYEQVLTDPWIATSLYEIFLELVFEPLVTLSRLSGRACGQFYHQLSVYFPSYFALPITVVMSLCAFFIVLRCIWSPVASGRPANQKRRSKPHLLKQKHVAALCEPKKQ